VPKFNEESLEAIRSRPAERKNYISVGLSACGIAAGADEIYDLLVEEVKKRNLPIEVDKCGCIGMCYAEPLVEVKVEGLPAVTYGKVNRDTALKILEKHVAGKMLLNDSIYSIG
jgi:NADP-reducing hydrogenase subunit HndB